MSQELDPFAERLPRTSYLVVPRLALEAMPLTWQNKFEALLKGADEAGLETPDYHVFRDDGEGGEYTRARCVNEMTGFVRLTGGKDDPWANYRYGDVEKLCPKFKPPLHNPVALKRDAINAARALADWCDYDATMWDACSEGEEGIAMSDERMKLAYAAVKAVEAVMPEPAQ